MKILIVEDDEVSRKVLTAQLIKLGHEVLSSKDGAEGFQLFQVEHPQAIITDWMMPVYDGLALCRKIREVKLSRYTYIIMLTALSGKNDFLQGMDAGADDFLTKPCDLDELRARLNVAERILKLHSEVKQLNALLPICAQCKNIRDDEGYWQKVEVYIAEHTDAQFTHGICPTCIPKLYPEYAERVKKKLENSTAG